MLRTLKKAIIAELVCCLFKFFFFVAEIVRTWIKTQSKGLLVKACLSLYFASCYVRFQADEKRELSNTTSFSSSGQASHA